MSFVHGSRQVPTVSRLAGSLSLPGLGRRGRERPVLALGRGKAGASVGGGGKWEEDGGSMGSMGWG